MIFTELVDWYDESASEVFDFLNYLLPRKRLGIASENFELYFSMLRMKKEYNLKFIGELLK